MSLIPSRLSGLALLSGLLSGLVVGESFAQTAAPAAPAAPPAEVTGQSLNLGGQILPSLADEAERMLPAVVEISVVAKTPLADGEGAPQIPEGSPFKDFFDEFMKRQQGNPKAAPERRVNSMGSGFIIDASGLIVTNNHVIEGAESIEVRLQDSSTLKAEVVGRDKQTDLAVLRVKPTKPLPAVSFGNSDKLRIGDWVMAIGNPFGLGGSVSLGIVSARNRKINAGRYDDFIQTDAAINKGNSGGPLFNLSGEVVGINTAIYSPSGGSVGIGFAVTSNIAKKVVAQLVSFGETRRGWLGVKIQSITDEIAESMNLGTARGALIADVTKDGPAEAAGMEAGDVVVAFNGHPIKEMRDLPRLVAEEPVGAKVPIKLIRKGKEITVTAELGRLKEDETAKNDDGPAKPSDKAPPAVAALGMKLSELTNDLRAQYETEDGVKGVVVVDVDDGSAAEEKEIIPGDVITEAGEKPVSSPADIIAAVDAAKSAGKSSLLLLIAKDGKSSDMRFIALKVKN